MTMKISLILFVLYLVAYSLGFYASGEGTTNLRAENENDEIDVDRFFPLVSFSSKQENKLFEGDIVVSKEQVARAYGEDAADQIEAAGLLEKSKEIINKNKQKQSEINNHSNGRDLGLLADYNLLWKIRDANKKVIVPYEFSSWLSKYEKQMIINAMNHIEINTGVINFIHRTTEPDWIFFQNADDACWSYVGRNGGLQEVNIALGCGFGAAVHEICHALGFWHEQSRSDRDKYVSIIKSNVYPGYLNNFFKENTSSLGSPYDYGSIMHYGSTDFGKMNRKTSTIKVKANHVVELSYSSYLAPATTRYCFTVKDADKGLKDDLPVFLMPCNHTNMAYQQWIIDAVGKQDNIIKLALDPSYCLTSLQESNTGNDKAPLVIKKCADNGIAGQHFTVYWYEWDKIFLLLRGSLDYAITGDPEPSDPETFKLYISYLTSRDALWSLFAVALAPKAHTKQSSFSIIENISKTTINAKGHKIGQRDGLSKQDIIQLQLLYQCPSGPRNINSFCSTDCKCRYGQGECTSNDQCEAGLKCMSVSKSMKKCLTSSPTPTNTPTKLPTQNPISLSPTAVPTLVCSYTKKAQCISNSSCKWINNSCRPK